MALFHSPRIVTNNLRLCLDAGNTKSYPGSGIIWTDLSGNGNNSTLTNNPSFNASNRGSIVFDGGDDYVVLPTNLIVHHDGNPFTISVWFRTTSTGIILGQQNTTTPNSASGYVPGIYIDTSGRIVTSCFWGGSTNNISTSSVVNNGNWNNITVTVQSTTHISYLNGISYASLGKSQTNYSSTYYYFLGTGTGGGWPGFPSNPYFSGNISSFICYNRALTASEVLQNFNALRGRYAL